MNEEQKKARLDKWQETESPFYRRWRVYSTFFTGFAIGLFYVLLISGKIFPGIDAEGQYAIVLIFSGILGGVIYTIMIDGHVEMPQFIEDRADRFSAGLFGDILLGIAGAIILDVMVKKLIGDDTLAPGVEVAAAGIVGGYGGRAILQFALQRVFKDINLLEADREAYLKANLQQRLERVDSLTLIDLVNQQIKLGLTSSELNELSTEIEKADSGVQKRVFNLVQDFRLAAKAAGDSDRIQRTIPIFEALIRGNANQHAYYAELAFAYKDSSSPDLFQAIQYLDKAIALRGDQHRGGTWNYELSRAITRIQEAYEASGSYGFDRTVHERIIADLLAVAEIYNLENILREATDQNIPLPVINWMQYNEAMLADHPRARVLIERLDTLVGDDPAVPVKRGTPVQNTRPITDSQPRRITPRSFANAALARWQQALVQAKTTGASSQTASQDGLSGGGVKASHAMAKNDWPRIEPFVDRFCSAGEKFEIPPALLAAIASRESRCGNTSLLVNGWGDHGNAFGIMQIDKRFHTIEGVGSDSASQDHINQATDIFSRYLQEVRRMHPNWDDGSVLEGAAVAYNSGVGNVQTKSGMNKGTTGDDYGADVIARAQFYSQDFKEFSAIPSIKSKENNNKKDRKEHIELGEKRDFRGVSVAVSEVVRGCDTGQIQGLSLQVLEKLKAEKPNILSRIDHPLIICRGSQNNPFLQTKAYKALVKVVEDRSTQLHINSCLRTPMQQHMLRQQNERGLCGIRAAAIPPNSNHNSGLAIDIEDPYGWKPFMERYQWKWLGAWDEMHFDFKGGGEALGALQVVAFQQLWNEFNPEDLIKVDGAWGATTQKKVDRSPIQGFGKPPVFKKGDFSKSIGKLQIMLRDALALSSDELSADNHFGSKTFQAVSKFQGKMGIVPVDGIVGPSTLRKLEEETGMRLF